MTDPAMARTPLTHFGAVCPAHVTLAREQIDWWRSEGFTNAEMLRAIGYEGEPIKDGDDLLDAMVAAYNGLGGKL